MTTTQPVMAELRVLAGCRAASGDWTGALARFFAVARDVIDGLHADIRGGRLREPAFLFGTYGRERVATDIHEVATEIDLHYPITLQAPFEDTASISGGLWSGRDLFGPHQRDGLAKLRFAAGTLDLPLHVHEHSDRFIVVLEGEGRFWWSEEPWKGFAGGHVESVPVQTGDVLVFTRNLLHTFSAAIEDLVLLSYHSPEIPFTDPRQYTLPPRTWAPRAAVPN